MFRPKHCEPITYGRWADALTVYTYRDRIENALLSYLMCAKGRTQWKTLKSAPLAVYEYQNMPPEFAENILHA